MKQEYRATGPVDEEMVKAVAFANVGQHEKQMHGGKACLTHRIELVAYLAHSLGLQEVHVWKLRLRLGEYQANCKCLDGQALMDPAAWVEHETPEGGAK